MRPVSILALLAFSLSTARRAEPAATRRLSADSEFHRHRRRTPIPRGDQRSLFRREAHGAGVRGADLRKFPRRAGRDVGVLQRLQAIDPCVDGGSGAWALGTRGSWSCSTGALEASLNANGNKLTSLANGTATGDSLAFGQTGAQLNTLAGAKGDGTDSISAFNVNGVFNVKAFGAKCDGSTDDTAAIQSALTAANASGTAAGAATVFVPATGSSCKVSRPIVNASPTNQRTVAFFGAGATASTISPTFTGPAIVLVGQGPASQVKTSLTNNIIPGGSGFSMTWASGSNDYFDLSEVLPSNINVQPYVGVFNGGTQWDIRLFLSQLTYRPRIAYGPAPARSTPFSTPVAT